MDRSILLIYEWNYEDLNHNNEETITDYEWFEDEQELKDILKHHKCFLKDFKVIDCIKIIHCEEINIDKLLEEK